MKMRTYVGVMLAATCMLVSAAAQEKKPLVVARGATNPKPLPPGGPAPRMSDGHIDLSGVWFAGKSGKANAWSVAPDEPVKQDPIPFQPAAAAKIKAMTQVERQLASPSINCLPVGTPGMLTQNHGYPSQFIMKPGLFVHLAEAGNAWRVIHTDGRPHKPKDELEPLYNGDQTAHWEGDTLVVDSISIDERTWVGGGITFHSDELHVIERFRRPSMNYLEYQYTVEDPKVLTRPWTWAWDVYSLGSEDLIENFCENNENIEQLKKLHAIEQAKKK